MVKKVRVLDTTLRDGEQTPGVSLTPDEKLTVAKALDELGVDVIEAGAAVTSEGERQALKKIAREGLRAEVASFARVMRSDVDLALSCDVDSVFLVVPTSDIHLRYKLKKTQAEILAMTADVVSYCKKHGLAVDVCCEDGSRTDAGFLAKVLRAASDHKADRFTVADTVGVSTPDKMRALFSELSKKTKLPLCVHCHDDLGLATANTVAAVEAGASMVDVAVNGLGERAGNASLEEVVMALSMGYGAATNVKTAKITSVSELVEKIYGVPVPPNKAIVGENAFTHEAGIHVDGILKKSETYEAINPELVGAKRRFVLGKHVGQKAVKKILEDEGVHVNEKQLSEIFEKIKYIGDKGKRVTSADLNAITDSVLGIKRKKAIELKELVAVAGNKFTPTASVKLTLNGDEVVESAIGTGPVDAAINAIKKAAKVVPFELMEYHVDAISGGSDALVRIEVKLKSRDRIVTAQGTGSDIVLASVDAMLNGMNALAQGGKT
jgi:D-citramalate synthase